MKYNPDRFVLIRIARGSTVEYKILGEWTGAYSVPTTWRLNTGIQKAYVNRENRTIDFVGYSGSTYHVNMDSEILSFTILSVLNHLASEADENLFPNFDVIEFERFEKEFNCEYQK